MNYEPYSVVINEAKIAFSDIERTRSEKTKASRTAREKRQKPQLHQVGYIDGMKTIVIYR